MYKENKSGPNPCIDHHMHLVCMVLKHSSKEHKDIHQSITEKKRAIQNAPQ
jgi:hypothetical protein